MMKIYFDLSSDEQCEKKLFETIIIIENFFVSISDTIRRFFLFKWLKVFQIYTPCRCHYILGFRQVVVIKGCISHYSQTISESSD